MFCAFCAFCAFCGLGGRFADDADPRAWRRHRAPPPAARRHRDAREIRRRYAAGGAGAAPPQHPSTPQHPPAPQHPPSPFPQGRKGRGARRHSSCHETRLEPVRRARRDAQRLADSHCQKSAVPPAHAHRTQPAGRGGGAALRRIGGCCGARARGARGARGPAPSASECASARARRGETRTRRAGADLGPRARGECRRQSAECRGQRAECSGCQEGRHCGSRKLRSAHRAQRSRSDAGWLACCRLAPLTHDASRTRRFRFQNTGCCASLRAATCAICDVLRFQTFDAWRCAARAAHNGGPGPPPRVALQYLYTAPFNVLLQQCLQQCLVPRLALRAMCARRQRRKPPRWCRPRYWNRRPARWSGSAPAAEAGPHCARWARCARWRAQRATSGAEGSRARGPRGSRWRDAHRGRPRDRRGRSTPSGRNAHRGGGHSFGCRFQRSEPPSPRAPSAIGRVQTADADTVSTRHDSNSTHARASRTWRTTPGAGCRAVCWQLAAGGDAPGGRWLGPRGPGHGPGPGRSSSWSQVQVQVKVQRRQVRGPALCLSCASLLSAEVHLPRPSVNSTDALLALLTCSPAQLGRPWRARARIRNGRVSSSTRREGRGRNVTGHHTTRRSKLANANNGTREVGFPTCHHAEHLALAITHGCAGARHRSDLGAAR